MSTIIVTYAERQTIHANNTDGTKGRVGTVQKERVFTDKKVALEFIKTHSSGNDHGHDEHGNYRPTIVDVVGIPKSEWAPKTGGITGGKKAASDTVLESGQVAHTPASNTPVVKGAGKKTVKKAAKKTVKKAAKKTE